MDRSNYIICKGKQVPIEWDKLVPLDSPKALALKNGYRRKWITRKPKFIVTHWDATLNSKYCFRILEKRGISTHFSIDNDGTIYQLVDTNDIAWHCGPTNRDKSYWKKHGIKASRWNNESIGIDFSNAYYLKYLHRYKSKRPIIQSRCHGSELEHLGYYPVQIEAYKALLKALCSHYGIPFDFPKDDEGNLIETVYPNGAKGSFKGILCHYHLSRYKIDCAGLDLKGIVEELKGESSC